MTPRVHTAHSTWRRVNGSYWMSFTCCTSWTPPVRSPNIKRYVSHRANSSSRQATRSRMRHTGIGRAGRCSAPCHLPRFSHFFALLFSSALACSSALTSSQHFVSAMYCVLLSTCEHVKCHTRQLRVVWLEGGKVSLVRKTRGIRSAGVQYQRTDGASQLTGDMSGVAPLGRFDQYHDATVTAVSLESRSRDLDLRRVSICFRYSCARHWRPCQPRTCSSK